MGRASTDGRTSGKRNGGQQLWSPCSWLVHPSSQEGGRRSRFSCSSGDTPRLSNSLCRSSRQDIACRATVPKPEAAGCPRRATGGSTRVPVPTESARRAGYPGEGKRPPKGSATRLEGCGRNPGSRGRLTSIAGYWATLNASVGAVRGAGPTRTDECAGIRSYRRIPRSSPSSCAHTNGSANLSACALGPHRSRQGCSNG